METVIDSWEDEDFQINTLEIKTLEIKTDPKIEVESEEEEIVENEDIYIPTKQIIPEFVFNTDENVNTLYIGGDIKGQRKVYSFFLLDFEGNTVRKGGFLINKKIKTDEEFYVSSVSSVIDQIRIYNKNLDIYTHFKITEDVIRWSKEFKLFIIPKKMNIKTVNLANEIIENDKKCSKNRILQAKKDIRNQKNYRNRNRNKKM